MNLFLLRYLSIPRVPYEDYKLYFSLDNLRHEANRYNVIRRNIVLTINLLAKHDKSVNNVHDAFLNGDFK